MTQGKLMNEGWVQGYVLNSFCRKLFRDNHPRDSLKHFFFHTMSEYFLEKYTTQSKKEKMKECVMNAFEGAGSAMTLHLSNMLYFPSLHMQHWFLFIVDLRDEKYIFLDSLFALTIKKFTQAWHDCGLPSQRFDEYGILYSRVPKQNNGHDCGIFVMKFMEQWDPRNQPSCAFSKDDIPSIRVKICNEIMFSKHNVQEDAKHFIWNFNPAMYIPGSQ
ncbi:hypothetical protein BRADI_1g44245v3 [Brachypodium distachyon]|uniref:Ubiquitin-like protease family profile domain-containing protein n=1 Tax=Brachypodium distachyon TaxID=15368 RepID=A0A0Q3S104_BRADI|nr:hypothetical protein BRADI_1g44245v3 [Brachypodium distachyon]